MPNTVWVDWTIVSQPRKEGPPGSPSPQRTIGGNNLNRRWHAHVPRLFTQGCIRPYSTRPNRLGRICATRCHPRPATTRAHDSRRHRLTSTVPHQDQRKQSAESLCWGVQKEHRAVQSRYKVGMLGLCVSVAAAPSRPPHFGMQAANLQPHVSDRTCNPTDDPITTPLPQACRQACRPACRRRAGKGPVKAD